ncbi:hypothetical protein BD289DRAFT_372267 [Coniella lustricola]|uniref:Fe2OG dioxygenase domain-containing protein n=1 Tax=Coniella lustricola TaxID=2025994 RepID=A0A2T3A2N0_9PEZI|nr:hypothetical protein BD289DRAFT_372267 [Coniella lustricola]
MAATTQADTITLRLASGDGPVTRQVLRAPPRDATADEIPMIDISPLLPASNAPSLEARLAVAKQVRAAATNTGFFYIANHGIPESTTAAAHAACLDFFRQDPAVKLEARATQSAYFNGYKPPNTQRINPFERVDVRESFSWTYDPRLDPAAIAAAAAQGDGTNVLDSIPEGTRKFLRVEPDGPSGSEDDRFPWSMTKRTAPHFQPAVLAYWRSCLVLARALVRAFALSLDLDEGFFDDRFTYPDASLALNYYPPLPQQAAHTSGSSASSAGQDDAAAVSIGSHTDFQLFTILWQDTVGGLQVLNRQGQWIHARPIPGTFVVNIADYLQRITNGRYQSTIHKAQNLSGVERVSMPFFFGFNLNESCGVLENCVGEDGVRKYDEISCLEWVKRRVKAMHDTKGAEAEAEEKADQQ